MEDSSATCGTVDAAAQKGHAFVAAVPTPVGTGIFLSHPLEACAPGNTSPAFGPPSARPIK